MPALHSYLSDPDILKPDKCVSYGYKPLRWEVIKEDFKRKSKRTPRKKVKFKPGEENTLSTKKKASFKKK